MKLTRWIAVKIVTGLIMIWVVASAMFLLLREMPGDPAQARYAYLILHGMSPDAARRATAAMYGFEPKQPLAQQYGHYLWQLVHLNLGQSIAQEGTPVFRIVSSAFPWTVILCLSGIVVSFFAGVALGVTAALRRATKTGDAITMAGAIINGIPVFVVATLLSYVFSTLWVLFPQGGNVDIEFTPGFNAGYIGSLITHAVLPVAAYTLSLAGAWLLTAKSSVISVLGDDFILAAELRGIHPLTVARYIVRNAMLPLFTILAIALGLLFSGSVFIEDVFNYPGLGQEMLDSLSKNDYPVLSGAFLLIIVSVIAANILADLAYPLIDPRVRRS